MNRTMVVSLVTLLSATSPLLALGAGPQGPGPSLDDRYAEVDGKAPGFGGMFYDENGDPNIYLTDPSRGKAAIAALEAAFGEDRLVRRAGTGTRPGPAAGQGAAIKIIQGRYSFTQLKNWHQRMNSVLTMSKVVYTDVDEASNRLKIGVENLAMAPTVLAELNALGIPAEAANVVQADPIIPLATLRDYVRPVVGGLQINFSGYLCTLGFNAVRAGISGFVTNSHCTQTQGGVESTVYYQPLSPYFIGTEIADPNYFTGGVCPAGQRCRYSDSSFAQYGSGVSATLGHIAQTTSWTGSITINGAAPYFTVTGEIPYPLAGDVLDKVGRTTGWTYGYVSNTCVNINVSGTNITQLCQDLVNGYVTPVVGGGDSGSPVFVWQPSGLVNLSGVLWGGNGAGTQFVFSAMSNIEFSSELGPLATF